MDTMWDGAGLGIARKVGGAGGGNIYLSLMLSNNNIPNMESTSLTNFHIKKCFVQRDYSKGTKIKFETTLPVELAGLVSRTEFAQFIDNLNDLYSDAEKLKFCEGCLACLTAYLLYCCIETHRQKCMRRAAEFIASQNESWKERGVTVFDPSTRGFRILEIQSHSSNYNHDPNI